jgi:hypothetical protein
MMHWQLFKGVVFISFVFSAFSVHLPYRGFLFFLSLVVSTLLVVKTFYPAARRTGITAGMAVLLNMTVWFVFHSVIGIIQSMGFLTFAIIIIVVFIALAPRMQGGPPAFHVIPATMQRVMPGFHVNAQNAVTSPRYQNGMLSIDLYHGTPDLNNVRDIIDYGSGFIVGQGNFYGTGVYFGADIGMAMIYSKLAGGIVKVHLQVPLHQVVDYESVADSPEFKQWCSTHGNGNLGDNITDYTIQVLRRRFIKVAIMRTYIALAKRTVDNERVVFEGITILGGFDALGNTI